MKITCHCRMCRHAFSIPAPCGGLSDENIWPAWVEREKFRQRCPKCGCFAVPEAHLGKLHKGNDRESQLVYTYFSQCRVSYLCTLYGEYDDLCEEGKAGKAMSKCFAVIYERMNDLEEMILPLWRSALQMSAPEAPQEKGKVPRKERKCRRKPRLFAKFRT